MTDVADFERAKRERISLNGDADDWSVEDAVLHFLDDYRDTPEDERPDELYLVALNGNQTWHRCAGMSNADAVYALHREILRLLVEGDDDE